MSAVASAPAGVLDVALQSAETAAFRAQDWFAVLRQQGWHTFQSLPMPTRDNEKWRFSDARTLSLDGYAPAPAPTTHPATASTTVCNCASVCMQLMKNRSLAARSSTAGGPRCRGRSSTAGGAPAGGSG
mgnify:CR=1 FL=1